jgi:hypothetical protein
MIIPASFQDELVQAAFRETDSMELSVGNKALIIVQIVHIVAGEAQGGPVAIDDIYNESNSVMWGPFS